MKEKLDMIEEIKRLTDLRISLVAACLSKMEASLTRINAESFRMQNELDKARTENEIITRQLGELAKREEQC